MMLSVCSTTTLLYNTLNAPTIQEGGTNLSATYLRLNGANSMTENLTANNNKNCEYISSSACAWCNWWKWR
jgi:hypothetical protein